MTANTTPTQMAIDVAQPETEVATLPPATRAVVALKSSKTEYDMRAMVAKHAGLVEIKDKAGREQVHGAAMELMRARTAVKKTADEVRDDAKKFNQAVLAEERRLTAIVEPEENRLKALRDAWDAEQERIKREAEERERQRVAALRERIQELRDIGRLASECRSSDAVQRLLAKLQATELTGFEEFEAEAVKAHAEAVQRVQDVFNTKVAAEREAARIKAEREELERQQAAQRAEAERLAAERAEIERLRAEIAAERAAVPAVVKPENQELADAVRQVADVGIAIADDLLAAKPKVFVVPADAEIRFNKGVVDAVTQAGGQMDDLAITDARIPDADLVDTAPAVVRHDPSDIPTADQLIHAIAYQQGVSAETACMWLCARLDDIQAWVPDDSTTLI